MDKERRPTSLVIAMAIHSRLQDTRQSVYSSLLSNAENLECHMATLVRHRKRLTQCVAKGWEKAAAQCASQVKNYARSVAAALSYVTADPVIQPEMPLPEVLKEVESLYDDFDNIKWDPRHKILSVVTDAIELEGVYLGEFQINLCLRHLGSRRSSEMYHVVALDPHPAGCNDDVTHPHVQCEKLCEGDAQGPIKAALDNGRVSDFFHLVLAVLENYNPHSPYVSLDSWSGEACPACGDYMEDSGYECIRCGSFLCEGCTTYCRECDCTVCYDCVVKCSICGRTMCNECYITCECGERLCSRCNEEGRCGCVEETEEEEASNDPASSGDASGNDQGNGFHEPAVVEAGSAAPVGSVAENAVCA